MAPDYWPPIAVSAAMAVNSISASVQLRRLALLGVAGLVAAGLAAGCRPASQTQVDETVPPQASLTEPPSTGQTTPSPSAAANLPDSGLPDSGAALPASLVKDWQPLSDVLLVFGPMTIGPDQVQWGSGQTSPYRLISTEGGYLLELENSPSFYDTQNRYIKLIPKADTDGASDSIEVAFYTDASQIQGDEYIMYGTYFLE